MRRSNLLRSSSAFVFAALSVAALAAPARAADTVTVTNADTSAAPRVTMTVSVPGTSPTDPLPASAFTVLETGRRRPATVVGVPSDPLQVILVLDTSGSMAGSALAGAKSAANTLLDQLPDGASVGLIGFGDRPYLASPFTTDRSLTRLAISSLRANGETALNDAVVQAARSFTQPRRTMVVLTDGRDTVSGATTTQAADAATSANASVYGVGLATSESDPAALRAIATPSGGSVAEAANPAALDDIYDSIGSQIASQYQLRFTATGSGSTGFVVRVRTPSGTVSGSTRFSLPADATAAGADDALPTPTIPAGTTIESDGFLQSTAVLWIGVALAAIGLGALGWVIFKPQARRSQLSGAGRGAGSALADLRRGATDLIDRNLDRGAREAGLDRTLERAGMDMRPAEFILVIGGIAAAGFLLGLVLAGIVVGIAFAAVTLILAYLYVQRRVRRRQEAFADQLEQTLPFMAGSLRAGFSVTQAIDAIARESDEPTASEFRRVVVETRLGRDTDEALSALAERAESDDFRWVVQAIEIHRMVGGDLAEVLDNVYATIRDRNGVRRQIKALAGEGKLSAIVLFVMPFGTALFIQLANPGYLGTLTQSAVGWIMILVGLSLLATGGLWMKRMLRLDY
ncbi:MAG: VWA domain-containing protein [Actinomycetes bacterium]